MESFQISVYELLYFVDFWGYFVTFILGEGQNFEQ